MRILIRDALIVACIFLGWIVGLCYCSSKELSNAVEALLAFPGHLLITIGYYAVCNVCYSILFISDCEKEYDEIQKDLAEGREFFTKKGIKYN